MRSFVKKNAHLQPQRPTPEARRFAPRGAREIQLHELAHALGMPADLLRAVSNARDFPCPLGRRGGEEVWQASEVVDWLERHGWNADAEDLRAWGG